MSVVAALVGLAVGCLVGWALHHRRAARRERAAGGSRAEVLALEVSRLDGRRAELEALLDVAGQESARLHGELAQARGRAEAVGAELAGVRHEREQLEAALAHERAGREADRQAQEAVARAEAGRATVHAAELELAQARARDAEAEVVAQRARLEARDATITELQGKVAALEAAVGGPLPEPDDLCMIEGVGRVLEGMLHEAGITTYRQLADLAAEGGPDGRLEEFLGRIEREGWSAQARELHRLKYGDGNGRPRP